LGFFGQHEWDINGDINVGYEWWTLMGDIVSTPLVYMNKHGHRSNSLLQISLPVGDFNQPGHFGLNHSNLRWNSFNLLLLMILSFLRGGVWLKSLETDLF
jgi:hypothetical protein